MTGLFVLVQNLIFLWNFQELHHLCFPGFLQLFYLFSYFIDSLRSANCFWPLIWLLLLKSANFRISSTSFSKFRKQLSKIFTQSADFRLSSKTFPGTFGVSNIDTLRISDGLSSHFLLASSSVFELLLKSLFLKLKSFVISIFDNSYYLNTNF